jgi:type II secretory ATPase GspE/PulE/Tfp pilus assembly ATPase PilB-like protein
MRFLWQSDQALSLEDLGFDEAQLAGIGAALDTAGGLTIIAGPTGSGKTTSAYAAINRMHDPSLAVVTAEDPVERTLAGIAQIAIDEDCGRTFSRVLRGILRLDPDIVMIGEIRDEQSAQIACRASLTGHRVVTTLHASDTREAWIRMIDIGVAESLLAATTKLIIAQRLLRRLCKHCRIVRPARDFDRNIFFTAGLAAPAKVAAQHGCSRCNQTGYTGRFPVLEIFDRAVNPGTAADSRPRTGALLTQALGYVKRLETSLEEAISQCPLSSSGPSPGSDSPAEAS